MSPGCAHCATQILYRTKPLPGSHPPHGSGLREEMPCCAVPALCTSVLALSVLAIVVKEVHNPPSRRPSLRSNLGHRCGKLAQPARATRLAFASCLQGDEQADLRPPPCGRHSLCWPHPCLHLWARLRFPGNCHPKCAECCSCRQPHHQRVSSGARALPFMLPHVPRTGRRYTACLCHHP